MKIDEGDELENSGFKKHLSQTIKEYEDRINSNQFKNAQEKREI